MKRCLLLLLVGLFLGIFSPVRAETVNYSWSSVVSLGSFLTADRKYKEAEEILRASDQIASTPYERFAGARVLGDLYSVQNRLREAEKVYRWCYGLQSGSENTVPIVEQLYKICVKLGKNDEAKKWRAIRDQSSRVDPSESKIFEAYMQVLDKKIRKIWRPPFRGFGHASKQYLDVRCNWVVLSSGHFQSIHISKSSGDEEQDIAAVRALTMLGKVPFPMNNFNFIEVEYFFRMNVPSDR